MLNMRSFGVMPGQKPPLMPPPSGGGPTGAPPQISTSSGNRSMMGTQSGGPMDPMTNMPGLMPMMGAGGAGPGAAGAGMGAALMATPQQQPMPGPQGFMPPNANQQFMDLANPAEMPITSQAQSFGSSGTGNLLRPVEPKFHFTDINTSNLNGIVPHISIDSRLTMFKEQPDMVQLIKISIEKSIQEWATPVIGNYQLTFPK